jgi:hypothetical protein
LKSKNEIVNDINFNATDPKELQLIYNSLFKHLKIYKHLAMSQNKSLSNDEKLDNNTKFQELIIEIESIVERIHNLRFNINSDLQDKLVNETL